MCSIARSASSTVFIGYLSTVPGLHNQSTIELDPGMKLEDICWREYYLWYVTRPMRADEHAETYTFQSADSSYRRFTVTIIEQDAENK